MTSPREQAIEEAAKAICTLVHERVVDWDALPKDERDNYSLLARAAIVKYEQARARLDGAKMMPREATAAMKAAGIRGLELPNRLQSSRAASAYRAMHDATPKEMD